MSSKKIISILFISLISFSLSATKTGKSVFQTRPLTRNAIHEHALTTFHIFHTDYDEKEYEEPKKKAAHTLQSKIHYHESNNQSGLAKYFLLSEKTELLIDETGDGDIGAGWFGLFGADADQGEEFRGTFGIKPKRDIWGVTISYHHDLSSFIDNLWFSLLLPFVEVSHDLNFFEDIESTTFFAESFETISEAFTNESWVYGKWSSESVSKSGLDDFLFKVGYGFIRNDHVRLEGYVSVTVPVNESPTGEFVFEPTIGGGNHLYLGCGLNFEGIFINGNDHTFSLLTDLDFRYGFKGTEKRTFDIEGKPWARYLNYLEDGQDLSFARPGINFFTRELLVQPGSSFEALLALHYRYAAFNLEAGYNFWWRNDDHAELKDPWPFDMSIAAQAGNKFFPEALISDPWGIPNPVQPFTKVKESDLDFSPAEHPSARSHSLYLALSASGQLVNHPTQIGIGASYEIGEDNTALDVWSIWLSLSTGF